jgi:hypothetical protein
VLPVPGALRLPDHGDPIMKTKALEEFQVNLSPTQGVRRVMLTHAPYCGFSTRYPEMPTSAVSLAKIVREAREHLKICRPKT